MINVTDAVKKSRRLMEFMGTMRALMAPDGQWSGAHPKLVALWVHQQDRIELNAACQELFKGEAQIIRVEELSGTLNGSLSSPLVISRAELLILPEQLRLDDLRKAKKLPPTVLVVDKDPGDLMQNGSWEADFRLGVYRTFRWPSLRERGFHDVERLFAAIVTTNNGGYMLAPGAIAPLGQYFKAQSRSGDQASNAPDGHYPLQRTKQVEELALRACMLANRNAKQIVGVNEVSAAVREQFHAEVTARRTKSGSFAAAK